MIWHARWPISMMTPLDKDKKPWLLPITIKAVCVAAVIAEKLCFQRRFSWILPRRGGAIAVYVGGVGRWWLAVRLTSLSLKKALNHWPSINGIRRLPNIISARFAGFIRILSGEATQAFLALIPAVSMISIFVTIWRQILMMGPAWALSTIMIADHSHRWSI